MCHAVRRIACLIALLFAGCSTLSVNTDFDPAKAPQLASYRTYVWAEKPVSNDSRMNNPIVRDIVRGAVERQLAAKGLHPAPEGTTPDVKLAWGASTEQRLAYDTVPSYYGYGMGFWSRYGGSAIGLSAPVTRVTEYEVGTLVVDMIDAPSNELVWRGVAQARVDDDASAIDRANRIDESVEKMFEDFPPRVSRRSS